MTGAVWEANRRLAGLRRSAIAITVLNILGHTVLGFEQSWAVPLVSLAAAYSTELLLERIDARTGGRAPRYLGSPRQFVDFLLSAHITGLAVGMLLYANERLWPVAFAAAAAIASKAIFRVQVGRVSRHSFNPSNFRHQPPAGAVSVDRHRAALPLYRGAGRRRRLDSAGDHHCFRQLP
jgi:hypothetical protein